MLPEWEKSLSDRRKSDAVTRSVLAYRTSLSSRKASGTVPFWTAGASKAPKRLTEGLQKES